MLLATTCPVCGAAGPAPCGGCAAELRPAPLLPPPPGVDRCLALLAYEGAGRELVARLKHRGHRAALPGLAAAAASLVEADDVGVGLDLVTWAPTTPARRRRRGFDQAELVAVAVARRLRRPARRLLARAPAGPGVAQTGRSAQERWTSGPTFVPRRRAPPAVLLVDDVVTTGATVSAAARALRSVGAEQVVVLALARTPLKPAT